MKMNAGNHQNVNISGLLLLMNYLLLDIVRRNMLNKIGVILNICMLMRKIAGNHQNVNISRLKLLVLYLLMVIVI